MSRLSRGMSRAMSRVPQRFSGVTAAGRQGERG